MASDRDLGRRIREARVARGLSLAEFAELAGVSTTAAWNWEMNGARPRPGTLAAIAGLLDLSDPYLLTGVTEQPPEPRKSVEIIYAARKEIADLNGVEIDRVRIEWSIEG